MQDEARKDELDVEEPSSRSQFLKIAGGTGAAGALALFIAACGGDDEKSSSSSSSGSDTEKMGSGSAKGDLEIVNYALTLEYLEVAFYQAAIDSGEVKTKAVGEVAKTIVEDEIAHVEALTATVKQLGGTPAAKPKTNFDDVLAGGEKKILETAASVENLGAAAYLGQAAQHQEQGSPGRRAVDPHGRGPPRRGAQQRDRQDDRARRRVRQAGRHGHGAQGRQAVHPGLEPDDFERRRQKCPTTT